MSSEQLKSLRERTGLNQTQFGRLMGMRQNHYSVIESGERQPTNQQMAAAKMAAFIALSGILRPFQKFLDANK